MTRFLLGLMVFASAAAAEPRVQTGDEALAEDASQYATQFGVTPEEALRRLKGQRDSVAETVAIAREFEARLAGISIEHSPQYRIVVLLTGDEPVADRVAGGVPIVFRTGARATHAEAVMAMVRPWMDDPGSTRA